MEGKDALLQYAIAKGILQALPTRDLLAASQVCGIWNEVGRVVRRQRQNRPWVLIYHPYVPHHTHAFTYFNDGDVSQETRDFFATASPRPNQLVSYQSLPPFHAAVVPAILSTYSEPQALVMVATTSIHDHFNPAENVASQLEELLPLSIPKGISVLAAFSYGLVAAIPPTPTAPAAVSMEMENSDLPLVSLLAIPAVPGLRVKLFNFTKEDNLKYKGKINAQNCKDVLKLPKNDSVKGIVLFDTTIHQAVALKQALLAYLKDHPQVALGGGAHYKTLASPLPKRGASIISSGLILCGDDNVRVASIGLFDPQISPRNEEKLIELKETMPFENGESFAFMFACNGRGRAMHGTPDVESQLFHKYFPTTPLLGTFTGGEYVHEVIPNGSTPPKPPKKNSDIEFAYATIFVLVTFKYPDQVPL